MSRLLENRVSALGLLRSPRSPIPEIKPKLKEFFDQFRAEEYVPYCRSREKRTKGYRVEAFTFFTLILTRAVTDPMKEEKNNTKITP